MDEATKYTDKKISKLIKEIESVYTEAAKDIEAKLNEFDNKYKIKLKKHEADVKKGIWTQEQLDSWKKGQAFQGQQWKAKQAYLLDTVHNANKIATQMINGNTSDVFTFNANYEAYSLEHDVGINFGFSLYDNTTVTQLIKNDPQILPKWKIDQPKDYIWNQKKLNSAITQGVIQGESLDKIANRISQKLSSSNEDLMKTFARTAMTGAQNSGRSTRLSEAKKMGLNVVKEWMSTLDDRTRDSHRAIDGEKISVGDKWHPTKFSNGCRFPGDPQGPAHEVYNCRCTLVGDLVDYPAEYERYDNIEGKPIKNMTYKEWCKAKTDSGYVAKTKEAKESEEEKQLKAYKKAQEELAKIKQEIKNKGADTVFTDIWQKPVTYADYDNVKDTIGAKKVYYDDKLKFYMNGFIEDVSPDEETGINLYNLLSKHSGNKLQAWQDSEVQEILQFLDVDRDDFDSLWDYFQYTEQQINKFESLKVKLDEFEKHGAEYSKLLKKQEDAKNLVFNLKPKPKASEIFGVDAYSQEKKDNALWSTSQKEVDSHLRARTGEVWKNATKLEKDAIYDYTISYSKFNEPLRGWEYGQTNYATKAGWKGVGNTDLNASYTNNGSFLNAMTDIIDKCTYDEDVWLQRGCHFNGMDSFFNCDIDLLKNGTQKELEDTLLGTTPTEFGFMSCGSSKGKGFDGDVLLNIFAPSGTKMMYVEPFSRYGNGARRQWDGESSQSSFGSEFETIIQQGTQFRVTKVEKKGSQLFFDLEVINQDVQQRWQ